MSSKHWLMIALAVIVGGAVMYLFGDKLLSGLKSKIG